MRSCARANDAKIVRSRDARCNTKELHSRVLHCAFLLRTNFASSARVQNIRDFLQTKLDSEIKANFFLNEHVDPYFLFYKFNENNIRNN